MYTIHPIRCGTISPMSKGGMTYLVDESVEMTIPIVTFLLRPEAPDAPVIFVDAGARDDEMDGKNVEGSGPDPIRAGLADHGLEPGDVDHVIMTHLHRDHAANTDLFPDAEFLLQRTELRAARDPLPYMERTYREDHLDRFEARDATLVDGGFRLRPGIELMHTPGHTRGMQSVLVETGEGPHALIGDLAYCRQNLEPGVTEITDLSGDAIPVTPMDYDYIAPGLHVDVEDCYESIARVRERVGEDGALVAGHATEVLDGAYPRSG